jgi:hypothetical protein
MKRWFGKLGIGSVFVLIGVAALAGGAFSLATRDDSSATAADQSADPGQGYRGGGPPWMRDGANGNFRRPTAKERKQHRQEMQKRRKQFESDLADELGVSQEKVHQAFKNLAKKRLDKAVEDGRLTRKQADKILECYDGGSNCDPPFRHRGGPGGPPGGGPPMGGPGGPGGYGPPGGGPPM